MRRRVPSRILAEAFSHRERFNTPRCFLLRTLPESDGPGEDLVEAFTALHEDNLYLPLILSDLVGDPVLGFVKLKVMGAQALERRMEGRGGVR